MICTLCPRRCGGERTDSLGAGYCRQPSLPRVARASLHHWEEPSISGEAGSGTIFFSGCNLNCVFCQNDEISHRDFGETVSIQRLEATCESLIAQGAHNLNFVNPSHYPHVVAQLGKFPVPLVWNTGGYDSVETLRQMEGKVDIYLPDLKYLTPQTALRYSEAEDYPAVATAAICEMVRQTGRYQLEGGLLRRGVVIRHLILPGQVEEAKAVMDWVAEQFPPGTVLFSLMSQYTPWGRASEFPEINRPLRRGEIRAATDYMAALGLEGYTQEGVSAQRGYTPTFDLTGICPKNEEELP